MTMNVIKTGVLALFATLVMSFSVTAAIEFYEFDNEAQEQQFKELGHTLRCPKCQNNTISDSNAELAQDLRQKVYEMTKEGKSKDEIVDYMIARYGNFVTYQPPFTLATSILWLGPLAVILTGFAFIVLRSRRKGAKVEQVAEDDKWDDEKEARLKALLADEKKGKQDGDKQS